MQDEEKKTNFYNMDTSETGKGMFFNRCILFSGTLTAGTWAVPNISRKIELFQFERYKMERHVYKNPGWSAHSSSSCMWLYKFMRRVLISQDLSLDEYTILVL